ncbi:MAG: class I SAM-dependent methyltransferase [Acidobacteria bacterium]|nr:class I SAM-dependent methyltransferase [Acidobacteriota bacterium]
MNTVQDLDNHLPLGADLQVGKMPAHWLMARLGKRILRPGGRETTAWLLERVQPGADDDVVELAPGLGITACELLARRPASYTGIERDPGAVRFTERQLLRAGAADARILRADAERIPLPDGSASLVFGEAMLSMQPEAKKAAIFAEVCRLLRPGGRYAVHELAVIPEDLDPKRLEDIQHDLGRAIHVGVRIGTPAQWKKLLEQAGLRLEAVTTTPMRLLEWDRLVDDEGIWGTLRFACNVLRTPGALARLWEVRRTFRRHAGHLCAVALVAGKP